MKKKIPNIIAVGMFLPYADIQLKTLMKIFISYGITPIKNTTFFQNKILKFIDINYNLIINNKKFDVIHMQAHSYYNIIALIVVVFWGKIFKKKIIVMYYGGAAREFLLVYPKIIKLIFQYVDRTVVAGQYVQSVFDELGIKTTTIPHVLELNNWSFMHRKHVGNNLLWVRAFSKEYNPLMLIKVFNILKKKHPSLKLNIVGTGPMHDEMKSLLIDKFSTDVNFLGRVSNDQLIELHNKSDIFINTTNVDNQPVTVLEAMASGIPVVSTNVGGIPNIIQPGINGMLCGSNDIDGMVQNIESLLKSKSLVSTLSSNGRINIEDKFGPKIIYNKWIKLYSSLGFDILKQIN